MKRLSFILTLFMGLLFAGCSSSSGTNNDEQLNIEEQYLDLEFPIDGGTLSVPVEVASGSTFKAKWEGGDWGKVTYTSDKINIITYSNEGGDQRKAEVIVTLEGNDSKSTTIIVQQDGAPVGLILPYMTDMSIYDYNDNSIEKLKKIREFELGRKSTTFVDDKDSVQVFYVDSDNIETITYDFRKLTFGEITMKFKSLKILNSTEFDKLLTDIGFDQSDKDKNIYILEPQKRPEGSGLIYPDRLCTLDSKEITAVFSFNLYRNDTPKTILNAIPVHGVLPYANSNLNSKTRDQVQEWESQNGGEVVAAMDQEISNAQGKYFIRTYAVTLPNTENVFAREYVFQYSSDDSGWYLVDTNFMLNSFSSVWNKDRNGYGVMIPEFDDFLLKQGYAHDYHAYDSRGILSVYYVNKSKKTLYIITYQGVGSFPTLPESGLYTSIRHQYYFQM